MSIASDQANPIRSVPRQDLTEAELDDLIWDIAIGRPTRVVLDTDVKKATAVEVHWRIDEALGKTQISGAPE
jgi:hypothetical protein